jgi:hypothetical protein
MIKSAPFLPQEEISFDGHETEAIPRPSIRSNSARIDRITLTTWGFVDLFYSFLFTTKLKRHCTVFSVRSFNAIAPTLHSSARRMAHINRFY